MNWRNILNVVLLQWFCVRLAECKVKEVISFKPISYSLVQTDKEIGGSFSGYGKFNFKSWIAIIYWVAPISGYLGTDFKYLHKGDKANYLRISKIKEGTYENLPNNPQL